MEQFAGYGFNKSHSAAYAYLAFVTAYLKAHYPVDFMAALLTSETGNTAKVVKYINECRDMGITVLPPDVNPSDWSFTPDGDGDPLRPGRGEEPGPGGGRGHRQGARRRRAVQVAVRFLRARGPGRREPAHDREPDQGRRHGFAGRHARRLFAAVEGAMEAGQRAWRDRESGQAACSRDVRRGRAARDAAAQRARVDRKESLAGEKEVLGFYVTGHPLERYADKIAELATHDTDRLEGLGTRRRGGAVRHPHRHPEARNKEGKTWASMQLEDLQRRHRRGAVHQQLRAPAGEAGRGQGRAA